MLKKEAALRQIASGYTDAESNHSFWVDLLAEVSGAFASDAVWLTDLEPITGFDPTKVLDPAFDPKKTANGKPVVRPEFYNIAYGTSAIMEIRNEQPTQRRGSRTPEAAPEPTANAIRIKGFWMENPRSQNVVSALLKNLRDKSPNFNFTVTFPKDPKRTVDLLDDQNLGKIMTITSVVTEGGNLAQPFEITLPLAREVVIK